MDTIPQNMAILTIGIVKQLTGLSLRQIRYYEEVGLIIPYRSTGEQRLYSIKDVERLLRIKDMIDQEYPIQQIKKVLKSPTVAAQPEVQPTPSEKEETLNRADLLRGIRDQINTRKDRVRSSTMIEGQLSHFYQNDRKK